MHKRNRKHVASLSALTALTAFAAPAFAQTVASDALPTGGNVASGQAAISTNGARMDINQSTQKAIINWYDFNIGSQASVNFSQPNSSAVALNRVTSATPSTINGQINANGQVYLINPSGIVFGAGASVNTGSIVASTLSISDEDFNAGKNIFSRDGATGTITNDGTINAQNMAALLAPEVRNNGVISAQMGTVALAAGDKVTLDVSGGNVNVAVDPATVKTFVDNKGMVVAKNGQAVLSAKAADALLGSAINNSGVIEATSLTSKGGKITLEGADVVTNTGTLDVSGDTGGKIVITGKKILVGDGSHLKATGKKGGGEIYVGGGWQGKDPSIQNAQATIITAGATLDASATETGNGGTIVAWSDVKDANSVTRANGTFLALGGAGGGDGGRIETSGRWLNTGGIRVNTSAARGQSGLWLLDPSNITISNAASDDGSFNAGNPNTWTAGGEGSSNVNISDLESALGVANVTISTQTDAGQLGDITLVNNFSMSSGTPHTLRLAAANNIVLNADMIAVGNSFNLQLDADTDLSGGAPHDGVGIIMLNGDIETGSGFIHFGAGDTLSINGVNTLVGGDVYVGGNAAQHIYTAGGNMVVNGAMIIANPSGLSIDTDGGDVTFNGLVDSGNEYNFVASPNITWNAALAAASLGSSGDGSQTGDTYLATITSRLENAVASLAAGYEQSWLGAERVSDVDTDSDWRWVTGPEGLEDSGLGRRFFAQDDDNQPNEANGTPIDGQYSNWNYSGGGGEPNNAGGDDIHDFAEYVLQFTGTEGRWNDLAPNNGSSIQGYVVETNLAPSPLSINAGTGGTVTFNQSVGSNKELASLDITSDHAAVLNGDLIATNGAQNYSSGLSVNAQDTILRLSNGSFTLADSASIGNGYGDGASLLIDAHNNITLSNNSAIGDSVTPFDITLSAATGTINLGTFSSIDNGGGTTELIANTLTAADSALLLGGEGALGMLVMHPYTNGRTVGVATGAAGATNYASNIFNSVLNTNQFSSVQVGDSNTGLMTIGNTGMTNRLTLNNATYFQSGGSIAFANGMYLRPQTDLFITASNGNIATSNTDNDSFTINKTGGNDATVLLRATDSILLGGNAATTATINYTGGGAAKLNVMFEADNDGNSSGAVGIANSGIFTNGGNVVIGGEGGSNYAYGVNGSPNGIATIQGVSIARSTIDTSGGNITIRGASTISGGSGVVFYGLGSEELNDFEAGSGDINIYGSATGGGGGYGVNLSNYSGGHTLIAENINATGNTMAFETGGTTGLSLTANDTITLTLTSSGTASDTANVTMTADKLLLIGGEGGSFDLTSGTNDVNTLAANAVGVSYANTTGSLIVGTVGSTNGVTATTGGIRITARDTNADLTLNQNVSTTNSNITLAAARNFINNRSSNTGIAVGGEGHQYFVYSANPANTTEGMTGYSKHYNQAYSASAPSYATSGNWFLYSIAPAITVAPTAAAITYGDADPTITPNYSSGFIDSDTSGTAGITGTATYVFTSYTASGAGFRPVGTYNTSVSSVAGLASSLGYSFIGGEGATLLTVQQKDISLASFTTLDKIYDRTVAATISGYGTLVGKLTGDTVNAGGGTAEFVDRNVGDHKTVNGSGFSTSGADAGNYHFTTTTLTSEADITPATLTYVANSKTLVRGQSLSGFSGSIDGFMSGDTQDNSTTGTLAWTTNAEVTSLPGKYAINGGGLSAENYIFTQHAGNAEALSINPVNMPPQPSTPYVPAAPEPVTVEAETSDIQIANGALGGNSGTVTVSLVHPANTPVAVMVNVNNAGNLSFIIPPVAIEGLLGSANVVKTSATLANGSPLPAWLHYDAQSLTFSANSINKGLLPLTVQVTLIAQDGQTATLSITIAP